MAWEAIVLIAWFTINCLCVIALVDKPREPLTPTTAMITCAIVVAQMVLVVRLAA